MARIKWEVNDGYCGSRPHFLTIPDEELAEYEGEERDKYIEDYVRGEFEQKVSYSWEEEK